MNKMITKSNKKTGRLYAALVMALSFCLAAQMIWNGPRWIERYESQRSLNEESAVPIDVRIKRPQLLDRADQITIVVLAEDVRRLADLRGILKVGSNHSLVEELVIVWNDPSKPEGATTLEEKLSGFPKLRRIVTPTQKNSNNRLDPQLFQIRTGAVMILDDDLTILPDTITCAHESWRADKSKVHGFGPERKVYRDGISATSTTNKTKGRDSLTGERFSHHPPNFMLPRLIFATQFLDVYFDPKYAAVRQYVQDQDVPCDDIAFASVATRHSNAPLVYVPSPHGNRIEGNKIKWFHMDRNDVIHDKETIPGVGSKFSGWGKARGGCAREMIRMLNWTLPVLETSQCSYSKRAGKALPFVTFTGMASPRALRRKAGKKKK